MQLHYFQRYHSKENVDTANTLLMLSRLYNYNADKFFSMLNALILGEDQSPELTFELQAAGSQSVPDAVISQKSFKIVVETKLYNQFSQDQLLRHLGQFAHEEIKVLLTLDPLPMQKQLLAQFTTALANYNADHTGQPGFPIKHMNITFEQLLTAMESVVDERDTEIVAVLDDFKKYCLDEGLIPDSYKWLRAITAGTTLQDNIELKLYYDKASQGYSPHGYIGLYSGKSIRAVGKLVKIVIDRGEDGRQGYITEMGDPANEDDLRRIKEAKERSKNYGYDLTTIPHRYFLVDDFYAIDFRKTSKNPIMRAKYFNLAKMFGYATMPPTEQIASDLDGRTWEEFQ